MNVTNSVIKNISRSNLRDSRSHHDPVPPNVDREGASSTPNVEVQDAPSGTDQSADPQLALQTARDDVGSMKLLSGRVTSGVSAAQNAPADLEEACNFEETYLKPLKIFDSVMGKLADVHPYAKVVLGLLSSASKIVLAQSDRDQGILQLLQKLGQVYEFMMQEKTLRGIPSMQGIVGRIVQQTLECSQFINKTVRLWDVGTGHSIGEPFWGHTSNVNSVSFSPDGTRIISNSDDGTVRVWYAAIGKSLQDHIEDNCSAPSPHSSHIQYPTTVVPTPNIANDDFISFSSNPTHALHDTAELLEGASHDDRRSTFTSLGQDGWMIGPNHQLLFWIPPASQKTFGYNPQTALIIPRGHVELDLSRMAHGTRWQHCHKDS